MNPHVDLSFPHRFACEVLTELPGVTVSRRHFFPAHADGGQDGAIVRVTPEAGAAWIGTFAFGKFGASGASCVVSMPDPQKICVVARGAGYVVDTAKPGAGEVVPATPIVDVRAVPAAGLVVFANYTEIVAYGERGVQWRTSRLAWDGLKILGIGRELLLGEYWDIRADMMQRFEVDLATGAARGGVES